MQPDQSVRWFVTAFNHAYPDWERDGDARATLTEEDVEVSYTTAYAAKCGPRTGSHEVYFARNEDWWKSASTHRRVGLLLHELAHYKHYDGHSPGFYLTVGNCYNRLRERTESFTDELGVPVDFEGVEEWLIRDPAHHQVDLRKQTVYETRKRLAKRIEADVDEQLFVDGFTFGTYDRPGLRTTVVPVETVEYEEFSMADICDWLRSPHTELVECTTQFGGPRYMLSPIPVTQSGSGTRVQYEATDSGSEKLLSLLERIDDGPVTIHY